MNKAGYFEYRYMTEFQSHEPEFDYLKSLEIEEKINKVRWCRSVGSSKVLLSTNDKTIKLWKVLPGAPNPSSSPLSASGLLWNPPGCSSSFSLLFFLSPEGTLHCLH